MHGLSYRAQVHRLRELALQAFARFPLRNPVLHFIQHGENATFRVEAGSKRYLLRVHRHGYHSSQAILEELAWLRRLSDAGELQVPSPVRSRSGKWLEQVHSERLPEGRYCDLLEWVHGKFLGTRPAASHIFSLGALLARLQKTTRGRRVRHRRYWHADGLLGRDAKFGSIDRLAGVARAHQERITEGRKIVLAKLRAFEKRFPDRLGLIHADLHFGNFVVGESGPGAIDFDDCGYGFHAYDFAPPLTHLENMFLEDRAGYDRRFEAMQEGYASVSRWDQHDIAILPLMVTTRRLLMLGWLASRADHPKYKTILPGSVKRMMKHFRRNRILE